jgi:hypothetical protein
MEILTPFSFAAELTVVLQIQGVLHKNQDHVSGWSDMTVVSVGLHYKNPTKRVCLEQSEHYHYLMDM